MNGLGESSILASRTRDFQAQPQSREQREVSEEAEASPRLQVAIALLRFVELISRFKIGVSSELEPVRHAPTIGEGLSFTVKEHIRGEPKRKVLKISKQNLSAGQTGPFDPRRFDALMREAYILLSDPILEHENILKMTAVTWAVMGHDPLHIYPALILERSPYGDLIHFQASRNDVTWNMRKTLCYDVAAGLEALHDCGIVHGDLKAKNILVFDHPTRRFSAKICDFGSAVILPTTSDSGPKIKLPAFTPPWNAPESRDAVPASRLHLTDVWSLGLLMWQILVHGDPFACLDLPLDPTIRLAMINKFLALPDNAGHIAALVERQVDFIGYHEVKLLIGIFGATLEWKPEDRDLVRVLELLFPHNGRSSSE
jgi:serine/threonine protein kinase